MSNKKVLIIGGGAAGMMAAVSAAQGGHDVHLFEKNEKLGKKIYITVYKKHLLLIHKTQK